MPCLCGLRGFDHGVAVGLRLGDYSVSLDLRDPGLAQGVQVTLAIADVTNREAHNTQAHVGHIPGGDLLYLRCKRIAILIDVLYRHRTENCPQMAFESLCGDVLYLLGSFAEELLGCRGNRDVVALDLDLCHTVYADRNALAGVDLRGLHVDGQQLQRQDIHLFIHRPDEHATTFYNPETNIPGRAVRIHDAVLSSGNNQHLVWSHLRVAARPNRHEHEEDEQHGRHAADHQTGCLEAGKAQRGHHEVHG